MNRVVIALATVFHVIPRPFGVSSIGALALYSGAHGRPATAWLVPLVPLTLGCMIFGFYEPLVLAFVYAGFALSAFVGYGLLKSRRSHLRYGGAVAGGALLFYAVSNFGNWLAFYPRDLAGFTACYINGLPFLGQAMLADAAFSFVLFGLHRWLEQDAPETATA